MPLRDDTVEVATFRRTDYRAPGFAIEAIDLVFDLDPVLTTVSTRFSVKRVPQARDTVFRLDGEDLEFVEARIDGVRVKDDALQLDEQGLALRPSSDSFEVGIVNRIRPAANTALMGLYLSNGSLFTQCEAEGFRRITYFPDRPDVMTQYRVTLRADRQSLPGAARRTATWSSRPTWTTAATGAIWDDPFAKPSYLFAAGRGALCRARTPLARAAAAIGAASGLGRARQPRPARRTRWRA